MKSVNQYKIYWLLILLNSIAAGVMVFSPLPAGLANLPQTDIAKPILVVANFFLILVVYGLLGLLGLKLARSNGWPAVYKEGETRKNLVYRPFWLGALSALVVIVGSFVFSRFHNLGALPHPVFPFSIAASFGAGIGEELIMRLILMSFWAWLLNLIFRRFNRKDITDWVAVAIAALAFGAAHLAGPLYLYGVASPLDLPLAFIVEMLVLNGVIGVIAGRQMIRYGFIAAVGVHFWTDIFWHVIFGAF